MAGLGSFLVALAAPAARRIAASLGVGVVSYAAVSTALDTALQSAQAAWAGLPSQILGLVGLSGIPDALSIIAGALVARASLVAIKRLGVLA